MQEDEQPPFLNSWNQIYVMVLIIHAVLIFLFYLFTEAHA